MRSARVIAVVALAAAVAAVVLVLLRSDPYVINARFADAGQLVKGGLVEVGGRRVGTIGDITLQPDGVANVPLKISDGAFRDLRAGTTAQIRAVGLSGVANRYVAVEPGPSTGAVIDSGGVLEMSQTRGIVDLDLFLDAFDPATRKQLQSLVRSGAGLWAGGNAADANRAFGYLLPALSESDLLAQELARDRASVTRLLRTGATTSAALASRPEDLRQGITSSATTLEAIASERAALASTLQRAPALLNRPGGVLGGLRQTLATVRPALREARPVAKPLARVLTRVVPVSRRTRPVLASVRGLLPTATTALRRMPLLARTAVPALDTTTVALASIQPIAAGLLPYTPDLVAGLIGGIGGKTSGYYDANGHYARISLQTGSNALTGILSLLGQAPSSNGPGLNGGNLARCAGSAAEPAPDASNPFVPDPAVCSRDSDVGGG